MKIYTGNFANLKKYTQSGLHPISIALSSRYFSGDSLKNLAPEWSFKDDPENMYTPKFMAKINRLSKDVVLKEIESISKGKDVVLLCHEKYGDFCHRHLVNKWIGGNGEFVEQKQSKPIQVNLF